MCKDSRSLHSILFANDARSSLSALHTSRSLGDRELGASSTLLEAASRTTRACVALRRRGGWINYPRTPPARSQRPRAPIGPLPHVPYTFVLAQVHSRAARVGPPTSASSRDSSGDRHRRCRCLRDFSVPSCTRRGHSGSRPHHSREQVGVSRHAARLSGRASAQAAFSRRVAQ